MVSYHPPSSFHSNALISVLQPGVVFIVSSYDNTAMFNIYVDADSFPGELLSIVLRRIVKESSSVGKAVFVSDRVIPAVRDALEAHTHALREEAKGKGVTERTELRKIKSVISEEVVPSGMNSADDRIVEIASLPGFCITHDIPLSSRLCALGFSVIDDRGHIYTKDNVGERLSSRNFFTELREMGIQSEKTKRLTGADINAFSSSFDSLVSSFVREH